MKKIPYGRILRAVAFSGGVFVIWGMGGAFLCSRLFAVDVWPHSALGWCYPIAVAVFFGADFFIAWPPPQIEM